MTEKIKILFWGDGVTPTGFSRVLHSIANYLPQDKYDIAWLAVNYSGDPHPYPYRIYPAPIEGDIYGMKRIGKICDREQPDIIFILNDAWVQSPMLETLKNVYKDKKLPKIVTYTPVDAADHDSDWYKNFDIVSNVVAYTEFGKQEIVKACPELEDRVSIIYHGVDNKVFYKIDETKPNLKRKLLPDKPDFTDSFIVLSAQRNQPRKRLDISMEAFKFFAENKPNNVKLYMHCGVQDSHIDVIKLATRYGIKPRLLLTNLGRGVQQLPVERLNLIYNACDVGLNTGLGEGWGLVNIEHAVTGAPQVVAGHSSLQELYYDCGLLVPAKTNFVMDNINTTGKLVRSEDVAEKLNLLYENKDLYEDLSRKSVAKFTSKEYSWEKLDKQWMELFEG